MFRASAIGTIVVAVCSMLAVPDADAQQASGIAGLVRDTSGAVLPGVTVEATSPALIEKVRTVITDGQGLYNVADLRPGIYSVTFSLAGFKTLKREDIQLTAGFTGTVNVEMQVGAVEETVTVTGASPLVDVRNVRQQQVISDELLDALPVGQKSQTMLINMTPGFSAMPDVGGSRGTFESNFPNASFRGKANMNKTMVDGMRTNTIESTSQSGYFPNSGLVEEVTLETAAGSAESTAAGAVVNFVPKDGGNTFKGSVWGLFGDDRLQSDNLSDALRARGLSTASKILDIWDHGASFGGPIRKDRIWFLTAHRWLGIRLQLPGLFYNSTQGTPFYTPDPARPGDRDQHFRSHAARVTWQVSPRNKVSGWVDVQSNRPVFYTANVAPEVLLELHHWPEGVYQTTWNSPVTSRLLVDAGASFSIYNWPVHRRPGVDADDISILDLQRGFRYNAAVFQYGGPKISNRFAQRFSVSYVTGSHTLKAGAYIDEAFREVNNEVNGDVAYRFLGAVPVGVDQYATPYRQREVQKADLGLYAQDQWSFNRLTLNVGLRLDYFNAYVPEQHVPAGPWVPARDFAPVHGVPEWTDVNPRLGVAYDLFGNGRTALKTFIGRYMGQLTATIGNANNPMVTSVNTVQRTWTDSNGNYVPDCDLRVPTANGECGVISDLNFGKVNPNATRWDPEVLRGFGARDYFWDFGAEVQHEIRRGLSASAGYYRSWFGNFRATDNLAVTPDDYSPFCVAAPADSRLPGGGGYQLCGLYDVVPSRFGQITNLVTAASRYGKQTQVNDFFSVNLNTRFGPGIQLGGGLDTGRTVTDSCFVVDSPQQLLYCHNTVPFRGNTQIKLHGGYPLPGDFMVSGTFRNMPGPAIGADFPATNAQVAPSLGRNLAACGTRVPCTATVTVPLIEPNTEFEARSTQLDLRLTKFVNLGRRMRLQANVDLYNALNANSVLAVNSTYGSAWRLPTTIMDGRVVQFSGKVIF